MCGAHRNSCNEHPELRWKFAFNSLYINSLEFKELLSLFIFKKKKEDLKDSVDAFIERLTTRHYV